MTHSQPSTQCQSTPPKGDVRCDCNALLAKIENGRLALKCKRCKRIVTISIQQIGNWSEVRFNE